MYLLGVLTDWILNVQSSKSVGEFDHEEADQRDSVFVTLGLFSDIKDLCCPL
jgi:hypothetical protein